MATAMAADDGLGAADELYAGYFMQTRQQNVAGV